MFDAKRLLKSVERAEKRGITMTISGNAVYLVTDSWLAMTTWDNILRYYRELLGHLVEVLGRIPADETVKVLRAKGDYVVEAVMQEVAAGDIAFMAEHGKEWPLQNTGLYWRGSMYQDQSKRIYRCQVQGPHLDGDVFLTDGKKLMTRDWDTDEAVFEIAYRPTYEAPERELQLWEHLESVWWVDWKGDCIDDWEQEEMELDAGGGET